MANNFYWFPCLISYHYEVYKGDVFVAIMVSLLARIKLVFLDAVTLKTLTLVFGQEQKSDGQRDFVHYRAPAT